MSYPGSGRDKASTAIQAGVRTVVVVSADRELRQRICDELRAMRWEVREAAGGAEAIGLLDAEAAEALVLDHWLPDLEVEELSSLLRSFHPELEILRADGGFEGASVHSPRRGELLMALRQSQREERHAALDVAPNVLRGLRAAVDEAGRSAVGVRTADLVAGPVGHDGARRSLVAVAADGTGHSVGGHVPTRAKVRAGVPALPEMVGDSAEMRELAWMIRLVAPRKTPVLIEGATGTGKELVAQAVHRLSPRAGKPFVVLNCAAIPESLLEAELFGHTRGAFTGAVQSRMGRVEAASGGTLFLDEIGEMPLALQAKMLRFLECGEIQRVGGNETMRVDVRIVAATHQPLKQRAGENAFRLDLYHRLAVFPVRVPSLAERMGDVPALARFFLERLGEEMPVKRLSAAAEQCLMRYDWPGNVRELAHVMERATILAEDRLEITEEEIRF